MSKPTILSPWFVVTKFEYYASEPCKQEWYTEAAEEDGQWTDNRTQARLFNSIHSATRVARAAGAYAVVVPDEEALHEYRPKGI